MTLVARVAFLVLVGATFGAFFLAQRLKSAPPVIEVHSLSRVFSPNGDHRKDVNRFRMRFKSGDDVAVDVVDVDGDRVRRLVQGAPVRSGRPLRLRWDGRSDDGSRAPDGRYRLQVTLRDEGRAVVLPRSTIVDTVPPRSQVCVGVPCTKDQTANIAAPGAGPVKVYVRGVSHRYATRFRVLRTDDGPPHDVARFTRAPGGHRAFWDAKVGGRPAPPGTYLFQVRVRDRAGNVGITPSRLEEGAIPGRPGLTIRALAVQPPLRPVTAAGRAEFFVDARGRAYRWRVRRIGDTAIRKRGAGRGPHLAFAAPGGASGAYLLEVRSGRARAAVPFLVQAQNRAPLLVVVPTVTWLGADRVDDPPFDGLPNTLADGGTVHWPRVFAGRAGLPAGFADEVAPLLVFLDRRRIRYDLTSDLDLATSTNPRASDRDGVLLAGAERWVTRGLARRLRRYALEGGRIAYFGPDALRRGVALDVREGGEAGTLRRPTQPTATDAFGARLEPLRTLQEPATLVQIEGDPGSGLMEGVLELPGFTQLEESAPVTAPRAKLLAGVGQELTGEETAEAERTGKAARELRPALTSVRLGAGLVIRVGLPEWPRKLSQPPVAQVTRNIIDLLRGVRPRIRSEG